MESDNSAKKGTSEAKKGATNLSLKARMQRAKVKLLSSYYGNPTKDMKIICVTGTTGKTEVAHFVHEILKAAGIHVAAFISDEPFKAATLHKFFSDAWAAKANYVVLTAPAVALKENVFYGLPIEVAALTNFVPASLKDLSAEEYLAAKSTLFTMGAKKVVLNKDDANFAEFEKMAVSERLITYGKDLSATVRIMSSKQYKKGVEAHLAYGNKTFTAASFLTGETVVSYVAAATAIAMALHIAPVTIAEGIANYDPTQQG